MKNIEHISSQTSPLRGKIQGYVGLLVAALFAAIMLAPWVRGHTLEPRTYLNRTLAFNLLLQTDEGAFLRSLVGAAQHCKDERDIAVSISDSTDEKKALRQKQVERACNLVTSLSLGESTNAKLERRSPGISQTSKEILSMYSSGSTGTDEYKKMLSAVHDVYFEEADAILSRLTFASWAALCLSVGATFLCVLHRRRVGSFVIYPFLVTANIFKLGHQKV